MSFFHSTIKTMLDDKGHAHYDSINCNDVGVAESKTFEEGLGEKDLHSFFDVSNRPSSRASKGIGLLLVPLVIAGGLFASHDKTPSANISETPAASASAALTSSSSGLVTGPNPMEFESLNGIVHARSTRCRSDDDCAGQYPFCLSVNKPGSDYPPAGFCYECVIDPHCGNRECKHSGSSMYCDNYDVTQMPGIGRVENLYNLFTGDPLHIVNQQFDPGFTTRKFYQQTFSESDRYKHEVQHETVYEPLEIRARPLGTGGSSSITTSMTSTSSYTTATSDAVTVGAEGSIRGVDLGGNVGTSCYKQATDNAVNEQTTVIMNQEYNLYFFRVRADADLQMTDDADQELKRLSNDYNGWRNFFDDFGTHLIYEGIIGSYVRMGLTFTREEREELETVEGSFNTAVEIGMPEVFGFNVETNSNELSESGRSISRMKASSHVFMQGSVDEPLLDPGLVKRSLAPVCERIDVGKYPNINRNNCFDHMRRYCIEKLVAAGMSNTACAYPMDQIFECVTDNDCSGQFCVEGQCVECKKNDDCGDQYLCTGDNKCAFNVDSAFTRLGSGQCTSNLGRHRQNVDAFVMPPDKRTPEDCADKCNSNNYNDLFAFDVGGDRCRCIRHNQGRREKPWPVRADSNYRGYTCYEKTLRNCANFDCRKDEWVGCDVWPYCPAGYTKLRDESGPCYYPTERIVCSKWERCSRC